MPLGPSREMAAPRRPGWHARLFVFMCVCVCNDNVSFSVSVERMCQSGLACILTNVGCLVCLIHDKRGGVLGVFEKVLDPTTGAVYYYNRKTVSGTACTQWAVPLWMCACACMLVLMYCGCVVPFLVRVCSAVVSQHQPRPPSDTGCVELGEATDASR